MSVRKRRTTRVKDGQRPGGDWFREKAPVFRFVGITAAVVTAFHLFTLAPLFQDVLYPGYLRLNTSASAVLLRTLGEDVRADATYLRSPRFTVEIRRGCEALEPIVLFSGAVVGFPVAWRRRLAGVAVGSALLSFINLIRIVTLYYAGAYGSRSFFEALHVEIWQPAFILLTLALWITWAFWATRPSRSRHDEAAH